MTSGRNPQVAFLLAQIGAEAANRFGQAVAGLNLSPAHAGIIRVLGSESGLSQQELAKRLQTAPSRIVGYLDQLQDRGLVQRAPGIDRRVNVLTLTAAGVELLREVGRVSRQHNEDLTGSLTPTQRSALRELLTALADSLGLADGAHPGYRTAAERPALPATST